MAASFGNSSCAGKVPAASHSRDVRVDLALDEVAHDLAELLVLGRA